MMSAILIKLIESHSDAITRQGVARLRGDSKLPFLQRHSQNELLRRCEDVCERLGHWLAEADEQEIEQRYGTLGRERFEEGTPLHETVRAAQIYKSALLSYARQTGLWASTADLYGEAELERLIEGFFDRVIYYEVREYETALRTAMARMV
jgi:hypothetical protein